MYVYNVDAFLGGDWLDITADVRQAQPITIKGGAKDEASSVSPSSCKFTLNDPDGDYNPRNPLGQYYGDLGKNTPVRVRVPLVADTAGQTSATSWLTVDGPDGPFTWLEDYQGTAPTSGDFSRSGTNYSHRIPNNTSRRYSLVDGIFDDGCWDFAFTGPAADVQGGYIAIDILFNYLDKDNHSFLRVRMDTDDYIRLIGYDRTAGDAKQLTEVYQPDTSDLVVPSFKVRVKVMVEGTFMRAKIWRDSQPEPKDWQVTGNRFTDRPGKVGISVLASNANSNAYPMTMTYESPRFEALPFVGEISEFASGFADESHAAQYMQIEASGITRRTIQGSEPLDSAMTRYWSSDRRWIRQGSATVNLNAPNASTIRMSDAQAATFAGIGGIFRITRTSEGQILNFGYAVEDQMFTIIGKSSSGGNTTYTFTPEMLEPAKSGDTVIGYDLTTLNPVAYWPCEDGKGATQIGSGLAGGQPMTSSVAAPKYAELNTHVGSNPILKLNNAELNGIVPNYPNTDQAFTFHMLFQYPLANDAGHGDAVVQLWTDSATAEVWALVFSNSGANLTLEIRAFDINGAGQLFNHVYSIPNFRDVPAMMVFSAKQVGGTVQYSFTNVVYGADGTATPGGLGGITATGVTDLGKLKRVQINPGGGYMDVAVGHIGVVGSYLESSNLRDAPGGNTGEAPVRRLSRLAYEENVPLVYRQGPESTLFMGPQRQDTLLSNWNDVQEFDLGRLYESRGAYSFEYRTRNSMWNQDYFLDVDYTLGAVADIDSKDDDQGTRNDITVKQFNGSSYRAVDESSPLSVLPPGEGGVGRYTEAPEVSVLSPGQLPDLANWRLALGTIDEERYPAITVRPTGDVTFAQMMSSGIGDRYRVRNLQTRGRYEPVDQLVSGYTLVLDQYRPTLTLNGSPSRPFNVAVEGDRLDSETSTLASSASSSTTSLSVTGDTWTTDPADFPFDVTVGGERMTVSNISGTGPYTFTVIRAVNGVVKSHGSGSQVSLADPVYIG